MHKKLIVQTKRYKGEVADNCISVVLQDNKISVESDRKISISNLFDILYDREVLSYIKNFSKNYKRKYAFKISKKTNKNEFSHYKIQIAIPRNNSKGVTVKLKTVSRITFNPQDKIEGISNMYIGDFIEFLTFIDRNKFEIPFDISLTELRKIRKNHVNYTKKTSIKPILVNDLEDLGFIIP